MLCEALWGSWVLHLIGIEEDSGEVVQNFLWNYITFSIPTPPLFLLNDSLKSVSGNEINLPHLSDLSCEGVTETAHLYSIPRESISDVNNKNTEGIYAIMHTIAKSDCFLQKPLSGFIANSAYITSWWENGPQTSLLDKILTCSMLACCTCKIHWAFGRFFFYIFFIFASQF